MTADEGYDYTVTAKLPAEIPREETQRQRIKECTKPNNKVSLTEWCVSKFSKLTLLAAILITRHFIASGSDLKFARSFNKDHFSLSLLTCGH